MKRCNYCGNKVPDNSMYCPYCNADLTGMAGNQSYQNTGQNQPFQPYQQPYPQQPPKNDRGLKIAIIVLLGILVLGGAIVATYFITKSGEKSEEKVEVVADTAAVGGIVTSAAEEVAKSDSLKQAEADAKKADAEDAKAKATPADPNHYTGSIGKYKVDCYIYFNGSTVTGKYRYTRMKGTGGWLSLGGTKSGNHVELSEWTNEGEVSGYWSGTISGNSIHGTMTNYKGTNYSFNISAK